MSIARVAARFLIKDLVEIYTVQEHIAKQIVGIGMGYRRTDMLHDIKNAIAWSKHRHAMATAVGPRIGFRETIPSWDFPEGERYKTYGTSVWIDNETGFEMRKESSFYSDTLWENDEDMEEEFNDMFGTDEDRYKGRTFVGFIVNGVEKNVDMGANELQRIR